MLQLDLFDTTTSTNNHEITISPAQHEIMQALVSGDLQRATQLIDLQHDTDLDLQQEADMNIDSLDRPIPIEIQIEQQLQYIDHLQQLRDVAEVNTKALLDEAISSAKTELMQLQGCKQKPNIIGVGIGSTP